MGIPLNTLKINLTPMILKKNKVLVIMLFIITINIHLNGQSLKGETLKLFKLNVPEIVLPDNYKYYDFELTNNLNNITLNIDGNKSLIDHKHPDLTKYVNGFRLYNNIYFFNPDLIIKIDNFSLEHKLYVDSEDKGNGNDKITYYEGVFDVVGSLNLRLTDKLGKILFEEKFEFRKNIDKVSTNESSLAFKEKSAALIAIKEKAAMKSSNYNSYHYEAINNLVAELSEKINRKVASYYYPTSVNLYFFRNAEKFDFDIKPIFKDLLELNTTENYSDEYKEKFKISSEKVNERLLAELTKISETDEKSELKKKWVLYTSLFYIQYGLGNLEKAQEYADKTKNLNVFVNYRDIFDVVSSK